jgi:hypothetical protein
VEVASIHAPWIWGVRVFLQLASLGSVLLLAPSYFRLLMLRALFGSPAGMDDDFLKSPACLDRNEANDKAASARSDVASGASGAELSFSIGSGVFVLSFMSIHWAM